MNCEGVKTLIPVFMLDLRTLMKIFVFRLLRRFGKIQAIRCVLTVGQKVTFLHWFTHYEVFLYSEHEQDTPYCFRAHSSLEPIGSYFFDVELEGRA